MQEYNDTDIRLHLLSQLIAKVGRTYLPKKEDDSHTNLYFDSLGSRLLGRWITSGNGRVVLSLNLDTLCFEWLDSSLRVLYDAETIGYAYAEIESQLSGHIEKLGLNPAGFSENLHFKIPEYSITQEPVDLLIDDGLAEWKFFRSLANDTCGWLLGYLQQQAEVRIWPHHFDTGIYFTPNDRIGIGYGLAMKDSMVGSPYLYFSGYAQKRTLHYENLPTLDAGRWEVDGPWKGAVLPLAELADLDESGEYSVTESVENFIRSATDWALNQ